MDNIDNQLKEIIVEITTDHDSDTLDEVMDVYVNKIKQIFKDEVIELIGEDDAEIPHEKPYLALSWRIVDRNELRAELRTKVDEYFGKDNGRVDG